MVNIVQREKSDIIDDYKGDSDYAVFKINDLNRFDFKKEDLPYYSLDVLINDIYKKPSELKNHIRRIFFCYHYNLIEDFYASILDLLIILKGEGREISEGIFIKCSSKLKDNHRKAIEDYFKSDNDINLLPLSYLSVLSSGVNDGQDIVLKKEIKSVVEKEIDTIDLANNYIEYSQLNEALDTLENGVIEEITREDIHIELLNLYKSMREKERFTEIYNYLKDKENPFLSKWDLLKNEFNKG